MSVDSHWAEPGIGLITLNEPRARNALTAEARVALRDVLAGMAADESLRAAVITGADGNFCAGGDVRTMGETDLARIDERMADVARTAEAVAAFPKPLVAAVAGHAAGGGVSLACLCDAIVADGTAHFTFSHLAMALAPDWALSYTLGLRVGAQRAKRLMLARARIDADEAWRIGLVDALAIEGELMEAALAEARGLAAGPAAAMSAVKGMLTDLDAIRAALGAEAELQRARFPHPEHQEAAAAFREKRRPDFTKGGP